MAEQALPHSYKGRADKVLRVMRRVVELRKELATAERDLQVALELWQGHRGSIGSLPEKAELEVDND